MNKFNIGDKVRILDTEVLADQYKYETEATIVKCRESVATIRLSDGVTQDILIEDIMKIKEDEQMENEENLCETCGNYECEVSLPEGAEVITCNEYEETEGDICPLCEAEEYIDILEEENDDLMERLIETEEELLNAYRLIACLKAEKL